MQATDAENLNGKKNTIKNILVSLGICSEDSIVSYYHKVRDRNDISVLRCKRSGVLFLSRSDHIDATYYQKQAGFNYWWSSKDREAAKLLKYDDDARRAREFKEEIRDKRWLDFGTGVGGVLDLLHSDAKEIYAIEPQNDSLQMLREIGYKAYSSLDTCPDNDFDVITLFHVLEHLTEPLKELRAMYGKLRVGGKVIIEVPHANDFLLKTMRLKKFKDFTFWSEHLILHTQESIRVFLETAGFKNIRVIGYQRFPFANHIYWLLRGRPGGHKKWIFFNNTLVSTLYDQFLKKIDQTDTLIAIAEK